MQEFWNVVNLCQLLFFWGQKLTNLHQPFLSSSPSHTQIQQPRLFERPLALASNDNSWGVSPSSSLFQRGKHWKTTKKNCQWWNHQIPEIFVWSYRDWDTTKIGMFRWALPWSVRRIVCTTTSSSVWIGPYFCLSKRGPLWGLPSLGERQVEERAHQNLVLAHTLSPPASGEFPTHRKPQLGSSKWFENGPFWNHPNQSHWNCPEKQTSKHVTSLSLLIQIYCVQNSSGWWMSCICRIWSQIWECVDQGGAAGDSLWEISESWRV